MDGCGCGDGFASIFDREVAEQDRDRYRRNGPDRTTRTLLDMIRTQDIRGATLLDVGGGVGVIARTLLHEGMAAATLIDGSPASLDVAREEAAAAGLLDRMTFVQGDFVTRADALPPAEVVTLDRVVCCYPDADALVARSADHATRLLGLVLPRDGWLIRLAIALNNLRFVVTRSPYRSFAYANARIDALAAGSGLAPVAEDRTLFWRVVLYRRLSPTPDEAAVTPEG
jgi:SAM-dependent methyltransferase